MDRASQYFEIEALDRRRVAETRSRVDLSVQAPREYQLAVHLKTDKVLGPTTLRTRLARAAGASGYWREQDQPEGPDDVS